MARLQQKNGWFWVALLAIGVLLLLLFMPHPTHADAGAWVAILPMLFVGLIAALSLLNFRSILSLGRPADAPRLPSSFQRPPPRLGSLI